MRAIEFITEDRITHIADMMNDKIIQRYEDETGDITSEITASEIVTRLAVASKKAIQWLVNRYVKGEFKLEDVHRIKQELLKFNKFKAKIPQKYRDLNKMSLPDLYDVLDQIDDTEPESNKAADRQKKEALFNEGDAELIFKDSSVMIVIPKTQEASCEFGKGTKWCTASSDSYNYFDDYNGKGNLYIVMTKSDGKFQFHFETNQFMDARDQELKAGELLDLIAKYPSMKVGMNDIAKEHSFFPLMNDPSDDDAYIAVFKKPWNLQFIDDPHIDYQEVVLRDGGLHNIKYIENPAPAIQIKALRMAKESGRVSFIFNNINNPTDEAKVIGYANDPDLMTNVKDIDEKILQAVLKNSHHNLRASKTRQQKNTKPGQATFDIVDDDTGEIYTRWSNDEY